MNARERRNRARAGKRAAWARSQTLTIQQVMTPATGRRGRVSLQGSGDRGYRSEWAASCTRRDAVQIDRRWDTTVSVS